MIVDHIGKLDVKEVYINNFSNEQSMIQFDHTFA